MIAEGYLMANTHPDYPLQILNYTRQAQFERMWNEYTLLSRGLVIDQNYDTVAIPFMKFFNYEELLTVAGSSYAEQFYGLKSLLPFNAYEIYDKMDGSLGIIFNYADIWHIATRGSFKSDQAIYATEMLKRYELSKMNKHNTYLVEIIYPTNRIVVDYNGAERLVLLGIIDRGTGYDFTYDEMVAKMAVECPQMEIVKRYSPITDIAELKARNVLNEEGYVMRRGNFRMKLKFEDYCRLHSIITNVSTKDIWMCLRDGRSINELLDRTPDEFDEWVRKQVALLTEQYKDMEWREKARVDLVKQTMKDPTSKKEFAEIILRNKVGNSAVAFKMFEGREYANLIWRVLEPEWSKPFFQDDEA